MTIIKNIKKQLVFLTVIAFFAAVPVNAFAQAKELVPMGCTIGISMSTNGVMVAGLAATNNGSSPSPAAKAGILPGDLITGLGGDKIGNSGDFMKATKKLTGEPVSVTVLRDGKTLQITIEPNMSSGVPEIGLWLRDGVSGVGTMTYYDPQSGEYGALGHSISDAESGAIIPLGRGDIMHSVVVEIVKSEVGKPGELHGVFDVNAICGSILQNTCCGIFGKLTQGVPQEDKAIPVGSEKDIKLGAAKILSNVSGSDITEYDIEIVRVYKNEESGRTMMIKIADPDLLNKTGGIVQGMSGSPIIQDGKLIGAVTHVLLNDPTKGYAVSIDKMLKQNEAIRESGRVA